MKAEMFAGLFRFYFRKVLCSILVSKTGYLNGGYSWLFSTFPQMFYIQLWNTHSSNSLKSMTHNILPIDTAYSVLLKMHLCSCIRKEIVVIASWKFLNCGFWVTVNTKTSKVKPSILERLKCRNLILKMFRSFFLFKEKMSKRRL